VSALQQHRSVVRTPVVLRPVANPLGSFVHEAGVCVTSNDGVSAGRQALRRKVNERLRQTAGRPDSDTIDVFCECGGRRCAAQVRVATDLYEGVVTSGRLFLVAEGHEDPATERAVRIYEWFLVVDRDPERASAA
jgi:hypothetical protein